jgi:hypothetical protein
MQNDLETIKLNQFKRIKKMKKSRRSGKALLLKKKIGLNLDVLELETKAQLQTNIDLLRKAVFSLSNEYKEIEDQMGSFKLGLLTKGLESQIAFTENKKVEALNPNGKKRGRPMSRKGKDKNHCLRQELITRFLPGLSSSASQSHLSPSLSRDQKGSLSNPPLESPALDSKLSNS